MFSTIPAGLAGTSEGQLFSVPTGNTLEIFRNDSGAATPVSEVPLNIAVGIIGGIIMGRDTAAQVRDDLELGTAATRDVGSSAGTVAAGDDARFDTIPLDALTTADVVQDTGGDASAVMSQAATTTALGRVPALIKGSSYTVGPGDAGRSIDTTADINIPGSGLSSGDVIVVTNLGAASITITPASGVTLRLAGTTDTGVVTLAPYGMATLRLAGGGDWYVSGAGLS